ncbi:hypothetical protein SH1V18_29040 [Vallitalea longa]|uniref:Membrane transport protein MMPL domain-containing protein n=1 Tax=Vallitalea longa TaxID=2936439 RepID=A0A9W6DH29_9FIRM|nr:MMPL family transporter [Vallitalea longa]GKX30424.1 hypothetical protein SH1V18_29040 [Vallitalea longa]
MKRFARMIVKHRKLVLIIGILLLLPSLYGMTNTRVNYDLLTYLPEELDSMKGQEVLDDVFHKAATGLLVIEDMESKDVLELKQKIDNIEGVEKTLWISDLMDITIPKEFLPSDIKDIFYSGDSTLMMIEFTHESASDETQTAIKDIRGIMNKQCFLSGMSAILRDTIKLADKETPIYVLVAVILAVIVLALTLESTIVPFIFLAAIGMAIVYNFGTNIFFGEISYITKSLAAVLQLGVTMDFSIFLLHRYEDELKISNNKEEAMAVAITKTATSIAGSSLTTIAGFLALAVMKLGLGKDIGFVMAKGVFLGVVCTITILPAFILTFNKLIHRFNHGTVLPSFNKTTNFIIKHYKKFVVLFILLFIPFIYGKSNTDVYYNLDESLPKNLDSIIALEKLKTGYDMTTTHMIAIDSDVPSYQAKEMIGKIEKLPGVQTAIGYDKLVGPAIPYEYVPEKLTDILEKDGYKLVLVNSSFKAATDEQNKQLQDINDIVKSYDENGMVTGEGALTKDLVELADVDFKNVSIASIAAVFVIILLVFGSISIPIILVGAIELAIFINMGIPYFTNTTIPFVSSIVIGTIQLGATVDYAILLTTRFREEIRHGHDKFEAMRISLLGSVKSIVTSALTFFGATVGVGFIADMEMIKSLTGMISRGAIISMFVIIFMLPALLLLFEGFISKTSRKWSRN